MLETFIYPQLMNFTHPVQNNKPKNNRIDFIKTATCNLAETEKFCLFTSTPDSVHYDLHLMYC
jgi:hypothetical protein